MWNFLFYISLKKDFEAAIGNVFNNLAMMYFFSKLPLTVEQHPVRNPRPNMAMFNIVNFTV
jgi:hypothetical protein